MKSPQILVLLLLSLAPAVRAQTTPAADSDAESFFMPDHLKIILTYKSIPAKQTFAHDTNPGDNFLPNAGVPGSAGTTGLNRAQYIDFGVRLELPVEQTKLSFNLDATGLFALSYGHGADAWGMNLDDRQNANDTRAPADAAFVYTDSNWGFEVALGVNYDLSDALYVGAVADLSGIFIENGWDRFSQFSSQSSKLLLIPAGGPKLGYRLTHDTAIEGIVLVGRNGVSYNAGFVFRF